MSGGHFESEAQRERRTERFHKPRAERACSLCRGRKTSVVKQLTLWASKYSSSKQGLRHDDDGERVKNHQLSNHTIKTRIKTFSSLISMVIFL